MDYDARIEFASRVADPLLWPDDHWDKRLLSHSWKARWYRFTGQIWEWKNDWKGKL